MNCKESNYLLFDYIDEKLTADTKAALEQHLHTCPNCTHRHEQLVAQEGDNEKATGMFLYLIKPSGGYKRIFFAGAMMTFILFALLMFIHFKGLFM